MCLTKKSTLCQADNTRSEPLLEHRFMGSSTQTVLETTGVPPIFRLENNFWPTNQCLTPAASRGRYMGNQRTPSHPDFWGYRISLYVKKYYDWICAFWVTMDYMLAMKESRATLACLYRGNPKKGEMDGYPFNPPDYQSKWPTWWKALNANDRKCA